MAAVSAAKAGIGPLEQAALPCSSSATASGSVGGGRPGRRPGRRVRRPGRVDGDFGLVLGPGGPVPGVTSGRTARLAAGDVDEVGGEQVRRGRAGRRVRLTVRHLGSVGGRPSGHVGPWALRRERADGAGQGHDAPSRLPGGQPGVGNGVMRSRWGRRGGPGWWGWEGSRGLGGGAVLVETSGSTGSGGGRGSWPCS